MRRHPLRRVQDKRRSKRRLLGPLLTQALFIMLAAGMIFDAAAVYADVPRVFANPVDSPIDPGFAHVLPAGTNPDSLYLYLDTGSDMGSGAPCVNSDGDHLCGYRILLDAYGDTSLEEFIPSTSTSAYQFDEKTHVVIAWSDPAAPVLGPQRIGELVVVPGVAPGSIRLSGGGAVIGRLEFTPFEAEDIAVPEPAFASLATLGVLALAFLSHRRSRSRFLVPSLALASLGLATFGLVPTAHAADPFSVEPARFEQMGAGRQHNCGVLDSGELLCWGIDNFGSVNAAPSGAYRRVDVGNDTNCALRIDGDLDCWGFDDGPIGLTVPPTLPAAITYESVAVGHLHACAVHSDQTVVCWGTDTYGESSPPSDLRATDVTAGFDHSCARKTNGTVTCWGRDNYGQSSPPAVFQDKRYEHVLAGDDFTCAIDADGNVDCWGSSLFGKTIPPATLFESLSVGDEHACALRADGIAECWGRNDQGETVPPATTFVALYAGNDTTCGREPDGTVTCWGDSLGGQAQPPSTSLHHVAAGGNHSCALGFDGSTECWGSNFLGQTNAPITPQALIDAGLSHTCGLANNAIDCWGDDSFGQSSPPGALTFGKHRVSAGGNASCMIHGIIFSQTTPVVCWGDSTYGQDQAPTGSFDEVSVGRRHVCAIASAGHIRCWGDPGSTNGKTDPPSGTFDSVSSGGEHSCGIDELGRVRCWGDDSFGQSARQESIFTAIAAGGNHTCGILLSGRIRCWGDATDGRTSPPPGLFETISANSGHTCASRVGGGVACWGSPFLNRTIPLPDSDVDGIEDGIDNCPFVSNADQADGDGDGAGDVCDVCPTFPDVDQLDTDRNGSGDRCDVTPRLELAPGKLSGTDATYSVYLDCGSVGIRAFTPEILIPGYDIVTGTPAVDFGDGCNSTNCTGADPAEIGATVNLGASSVFFHPTAYAGRQDALQLNLIGTANLCNPKERVFLGTLRIDGVTDFGVHPHSSSPSVNDSPIESVASNAGEPKPTHSWGPPNADTQILMETLGDGTYRVGLVSEIDVYRATIGIRIPIGATMTDVSIGEQAAPIWIASSSSVGPGLGFPLRADTRYFQFLGGAPSGGLPNPRLNEAGDLNPRPLVTFTINGGGSTPPVLESEGVEDAFLDSAFLASAGGAVGLEEVGHEFFTSGNDTDSDLVSDELDNCPFAANFDQLDDGGFATPGVQNGRGNACECGDTTDDGSVTLAGDPDGMIDFLLGRPQAAANAGSLCSVTGGVECDAADLVGLGLAFDGTVTGVQSVCGAAAGESLFNP